MNTIGEEESQPDFNKENEEKGDNENMNTIGEEQNHPDVKKENEEKGHNENMNTIREEENHPDVKKENEEKGHNENMNTIGEEENHPDVKKENEEKGHNKNMNTIGEEENHPDVKKENEEKGHNVPLSFGTLKAECQDKKPYSAHVTCCPSLRDCSSFLGVIIQSRLLIATEEVLMRCKELEACKVFIKNASEVPVTCYLDECSFWETNKVFDGPIVRVINTEN